FDLLGHGREVANLLEELTVGLHVLDRARVFLVPSVEFALELVALLEQLGVLRTKLLRDGVETAPESTARDARARQHAVFDETIEIRGDLQAVHLGAGRIHGNAPDLNRDYSI